MDIQKYFNIILSFTLKREGRDAINNRRTPQPEKIKNYKLVKDLQPEKNYPFKIGIYKNRRGEKFVIKVWIGGKNIHYYDLQHQIRVLRVMNAVSDRERGRFPKEILEVKWPKLIEVIVMGDMTAIVTNYIVASPVEKIKDVETQWDYYKKVEKYLTYINHKLTKEEKKQIKFKSITEFLILLPFITVLSLLENPDKKGLILKSVLKMIKAVPAFMNYNKFAVIHGDLNYGNILVNGNSVYLIDVEQTNVSYREFELVTTLSTLGNTKRFKNRVIDNINHLAKMNIKISQRLGFLMLNCEIHNLTWNAPKENKVHYLELLDMGQKLIDHKI